jgi:hypothetical protein
LDGLSFLSIDADERNWLERDFEESEVWEVVRDLNGDKAMTDSLRLFSRSVGGFEKGNHENFQGVSITSWAFAPERITHTVLFGPLLSRFCPFSAYALGARPLCVELKTFAYHLHTLVLSRQRS